MNTDKLVSFYQHPFESDNGHDYHTNIKTIFEFIKSGKYAIPQELATEIESPTDKSSTLITVPSVLVIFVPNNKQKSGWLIVL